jgi:hypothetical protein
MDIVRCIISWFGLRMGGDPIVGSLELVYIVPFLLLSFAF